MEEILPSRMTHAATKAQLPRHVRDIIEMIKTERAQALKEFVSFANRAVRIGEMLHRLKGSTDHGQWAATLLEINIKERTAQRWIAHYRERLQFKPEKDGFALNDLQTTAELMRCEGKVKPCHGAKTGKSDYQRRKAEALQQEEFAFLYDKHFMPFVGTLLRARCIEEYEPSTVRQMRKHLAEVDARLADIEKRQSTIDLQP